MCFETSAAIKTDDDGSIDKAQKARMQAASHTRAFMQQKTAQKSLGYTNSFLNPTNMYGK